MNCGVLDEALVGQTGSLNYTNTWANAGIVATTQISYSYLSLCCMLNEQVNTTNLNQQTLDFAQLVNNGSTTS